MCENLKTSRVRCDVCRTINLAKNAKHPKPDMGMYEKCTPMEKLDCGRITELPLQPTCIKVCTKEEFKLRGTKPIVPRMPHYAHGKLLYALKAGILVGAVYFTHTQGVWGDQQDVTECIKRWKEYVRSINTRRPPTFDNCGKVLEVFLTVFKISEEFMGESRTIKRGSDVDSAAVTVILNSSKKD